MDIGKDEDFSELVGHQFFDDNYNLDKLREDSKTYFIKTHEKLDEKVKEEDLVIYLLRDGFSATSSWIKKEINNKSETINSDIIFGNNFINSTWGEHVESWEKFRGNILKINFEDLVNIEKFEENINLLSNFLQLSSTDNSVPGFKELNKNFPNFFNVGNNLNFLNVLTEDEVIVFVILNFHVLKKHGYLYENKYFETLQDKNLNIEDLHQIFSNMGIIDLISSIINARNKSRKYNQKVEKKLEKLASINNELSLKLDELSLKLEKIFNRTLLERVLNKKF